MGVCHIEFEGAVAGKLLAIPPHLKAGILPDFCVVICVVVMR